MDYIIVCTLAYICIVGFLYQPKNTAPSTASIPTPDAPINYFPEPEAPEPFPTADAVAHGDWEEIALYDPQFRGMTADDVKRFFANEPPDHTGMEEYDPTPAELPLETMKVRELYKVAATAGIPQYKAKSKATLVTLLRQEWAGVNPVPSV